MRNIVSNIHISNYGNNVSDHLPVELTLNAVVSITVPPKHKLQSYVNWGKLSENDLELFEQNLTRRLNAINVPSFVFHGSHVCLDDHHKVLIENYYEDIVSAIVDAESLLPKTNPNIHRSFWSEELSELKRASIECTSFWKSSGSPKEGPFFSM